MYIRTIYLEPDALFLRVRYLLRRDKITDRARRIEALSQRPWQPLLLQCALQRPIGHVQCQAVARHVLQSRGLWDIGAGLANHYAQFHFMVQLIIALRNLGRKRQEVIIIYVGWTERKE